MKQFLVVITFFLFISSCKEESNPVSKEEQHASSGNITFTFDKANAPAAVQTLTTTLTRSGFDSISKTIDIDSDTSAMLLFEEVPIGTWDVQVDAKNNAGKILYTGHADVLVQDGMVSQVSLVLSPVATGVGSVQINVTWGVTSKLHFPKLFGGSGRDLAMCVIQTNDGGYVLGGINNSMGNGGDAWVVKTNSIGDLAWSKKYGGSSEDRINDIVQTEDNGYLCVGYTTSNGEDSWIVKIDSIGTKIWEKNQGVNGHDAYLKIKKGSDGSYWICGYSDDGSYYDGRVAKVTTAGDIIWSKTYGGTGGDFAMNIYPIAENAIVVGNNGSIPGQHYDFWAFKISASGDSIWEKNYGGTSDDRVAGMCFTSSESFLLSGYTTSYGDGTQNGWIVQIDGNGNKIWAKTYGGSGADYLSCIEKSVDNKYVGSGFSSSYGHGQQGWLIKIDINGSILWSKTFGGEGTESIGEHAMTLDGGIVFGGYSSSTENGIDDYWLGKTNSNGEMQ